MNDKSELSFSDEVTVRKVFVNDEWLYVLSDVISSFVYPENADEYLTKIRSFDIEFDKWCNNNLRLLSLRDGDRENVLYFINIEGVFRVIQSLPVPLAEPFRLWLATLARTRLESYKQDF